MAQKIRTTAKHKGLHAQPSTTNNNPFRRTLNGFFNGIKHTKTHNINL